MLGLHSSLEIWLLSRGVDVAIAIWRAPEKGTRIRFETIL